MYLDGESPSNPYVSPILGDMKGLPPVLIQTGTHDLLMQDSKALEQKLEEAGVKVLARYFKGFPHVFHYFWPQFYPAEAALDSAGDWIRSLK
jgi:phosphinothricin tripeptide acetyl hydrolase